MIMSIPLSENTEFLLQNLFSPEFASRIGQALLDQVSENIPFCDETNSIEMERIRFSVIRLIHNDPNHFKDAIELACRDWRDLFLAAGFGEPTDHLDWFNSIRKSE